MRVVHVLNELKPSGAETMLRSAARYLASDGVEGIILTTGDAPGSYATDLREAGYQVVHVPFDRSLRFAVVLYRALRSIGPDIVHVHTERAYWLYILLARLAGVHLTVRTVHHLFRFGGWLRLRKRLERNIAWHLLGTKFVTNSPSNQRNEEAAYNNPCLLIPNWYDEETFVMPTGADRAAAREGLGIGAGTFVVVSLGGNWPYKNYRYIVEALDVLKRDGVDDVLYLQVGPDAQGEIERAARMSGLGDRVWSCGAVDDPVPYLHAANAYLMPSSEEGFGIAAVEAIAAGLVPILSDVAALTDFKAFGLQAFWVNPSVVEIADAMRNCMGCAVDRVREVVAGNERIVRENFSTAVGARAYRELYWDLVRDRQATR